MLKYLSLAWYFEIPLSCLVYYNTSFLFSTLKFHSLTWYFEIPLSCLVYWKNPFLLGMLKYPFLTWYIEIPLRLLGMLKYPFLTWYVEIFLCCLAHIPFQFSELKCVCVCVFVRKYSYIVDTQIWQLSSVLRYLAVTDSFSCSLSLYSSLIYILSLSIGTLKYISLVSVDKWGCQDMVDLFALCKIWRC